MNNRLVFFPLHIIIKDLSFFICYCYLMRWSVFNRLGELNSPDKINAYKNSTFLETLESAAYYFIIFIFISFVLYLPIYFIIKWLVIHEWWNIIVTAIVLSITTPLFFWMINGYKHNDYYLIETEIASWIICSILSIATYILINYKREPDYAT